MNPPPRSSPFPRFTALLASLSLSLLTLAGCASHSHRPKHPEPPQPPLAGETTFFDGQVEARASLTAFSTGHQPADLHGDHTDAPHNPHAKDKIKTDNHEEEPTEGRLNPALVTPRSAVVNEDDAEGMEIAVSRHESNMPDENGEDEGAPPPPRDQSPMDLFMVPRQTLHVSFINKGTAPCEFEIVGLRSVLGNFAPRPEKLALAPGASGRLDVVSGDAGGALDMLEITLTLRRGKASETKVFPLVLQPAPPATPAH